MFNFHPPVKFVLMVIILYPHQIHVCYAIIDAANVQDTQMISQNVWHHVEEIDLISLFVNARPVFTSQPSLINSVSHAILIVINVMDHYLMNVLSAKQTNFFTMETALMNAHQDFTKM